LNAKAHSPRPSANAVAAVCARLEEKLLLSETRARLVRHWTDMLVGSSGEAGLDGGVRVAMAGVDACADATEADAD
jgi:hypothetical protein